MNQALQVRIVLGFGISSAGRTEGNQFGVLQGQILGAEEEFQILGIRAGIPSLDETDPQRIQGLDLERRLSRLTRWVLEAERAGIRYRLLLPGLSVGPNLGPAHRLRALKALALHALPSP